MDTITRGCKGIAVSRKVTRYVLSFKLTILHLGRKRGEYEICAHLRWPNTVLARAFRDAI